MTDEEKYENADFALTHLGIKKFSNIVILCGHGSLTTNNAFASSLDCGACGGHAGDLNARFLCYLLNDKKVRRQIAQKGKHHIPEKTQFISALHETVSDEIYFLDQQNFSNETSVLIAELQKNLKQASQASQQERNSRLNRMRPSAADLSTNWGEVRPDWALVRNACFIIAPRERTKNIHFSGRAFLHDYDYQQDEDMKTLQLIMTAPMIVTNWINMQYYASSVCPGTYGVWK